MEQRSAMSPGGTKKTAPRHAVMMYMGSTRLISQ